MKQEATVEKAKLSQLKAGDKIWTDRGFDCMDSNVQVVEENHDGLFVKCSHGRHYLSGQLDDKDGDTLVGMFIPA